MRDGCGGGLGVDEPVEAFIAELVNEQVDVLPGFGVEVLRGVDVRQHHVARHSETKGAWEIFL